VSARWSRDVHGDLRADRRGAVSILVALSSTVLIGCAALAVDIGWMTYSSRRLQGLADSAALAAATVQPAAREATVRQVIATAGGTTIRHQIVPGSYAMDRTVPVGSRFVAGPAGRAVRVELQQDIPAFFSRVLTGQPTLSTRSEAVAGRVDYAAFSLGSGLARMNGGLPGQLLSALAGTELNLSVSDYNALAAADLDLLALVPALRTRAGLTVATFDDLAGVEVDLPDLVLAMADVAGGGASQVLGRLALRVPDNPLRLAALFDLGPLGAIDAVSDSDHIGVNAGTLLGEMLMVADGERQIALNLGASVPGVAATTVQVAVGARPSNSPWLRLSEDGDVTISTAQQRIMLDSKVGVPGLAQVHLPVVVGLAAAEARLEDVSCAGGQRTVALEVRPSPGTVAIAAVAPGSLDDMDTPLTLQPARIVALPGIEITAMTPIGLAAEESWQRVSFDEAAIARRTPQTVASKTPVQGIAQSLSGMTLQGRVLGIRADLSVIGKLVGSTLAGVGPALDALLDQVLMLLGLKIGVADVTVNGVRCGRATLLA
jgi:uncharacterized membrane protein